MAQKGKCDSFGNKALVFDRFEQTFNFKMPGGRSTHRTCVGCFLSIVLLAVILLFALIKYDSVKADPVIIESVQESFFDAEKLWSLEDAGLNIAFGITAFDGGQEQEED